MKLMLSLGPLPDSDKERSVLVSDRAVYTENISKVGMAALVKRYSESDPRLDGNKFPPPAYLISHYEISVFLPNQLLFLHLQLQGGQDRLLSRDTSKIVELKSLSN
ncbi:MAG: hypothetical protein MUP98_13955 [Candidatus Aminicenantes bacterium]|nr:hypothetical protein [Candidatus Aminicenantes bacterium]